MGAAPRLHSSIHVCTVLKVVTVIKDGFQHAKECWATAASVALVQWYGYKNVHTHTHWLCLHPTVQETNKKKKIYCIRCFFGPFSAILAFNLAASAHWIGTPPPPSRLSAKSLRKTRLPWPVSPVSMEAGWGLCEVKTDSFYLHCSSTTIKYNFGHPGPRFIDFEALHLSKCNLMRNDYALLRSVNNSYMHFFNLKFQICTQVHNVCTVYCVGEHSEYDWHRSLRQFSIWFQGKSHAQNSM